MQSALDLLSQHDNIEKMSTGSAEIDWLIDGMQESLFYLFYSTPENQIILDSFLNRMLVGCVLPKNGKKRGFESVAVFFNNIDYRADKNKHQILNPEKIAVTSKYAGIEPKIVSKNLYVQTAYNVDHQVAIAEEIADKIESNSDIKLLAIRNLTKFFLNNERSDKSQDSSTLKKVLSILYQACVKHKVMMAATGHCNYSSNGMVSRPIGGTYLKHTVNVIVHLKPNPSGSYYIASSSSNSSFTSYKATMIKHPYQLTPKSINFYAKKIGKRRNPMLYIFD
jgi:DNA repair protein RadA